MSYLDLGVRYMREKSMPQFYPKAWLAEGIKKSVQEGLMEPTDRFVKEEDYNKLKQASEIAAADLATRNYAAGQRLGFLKGMLIAAPFIVLCGILLMAR